GTARHRDCFAGGSDAVSCDRRDTRAVAASLCLAGPVRRVGSSSGYQGLDGCAYRVSAGVGVFACCGEGFAWLGGPHAGDRLDGEDEFGGVEGAGDGAFVECCGDLGDLLAGGFFDTGAWGGVGAALELVPGDE